MLKIARWMAVLAAIVMTGAAQADPVFGQGTWETTLLGRDINGNAVAALDASAVFLYDTDLNITWLSNANVNGAMGWNAANAWANNLVVGSYTSWRLPTVRDTGAPGCDDSGYAGGTDCGFNVDTTVVVGEVNSEMAHLYYVTLGNKAYCLPGDATCAGDPQPGGLTNTGSFQNLQSWAYWSGTAYAPYPSIQAWFFNSGLGNQGNGLQDSEVYAMAVRSGDVAAAVPEPQPYALLLAGLGALVVVVVRRRQV